MVSPNRHTGRNDLARCGERNGLFFGGDQRNGNSSSAAIAFQLFRAFEIGVVGLLVFADDRAG